jgi:xanthine dehydrogenase YagR molybdenum-binding subunit
MASWPENPRLIGTKIPRLDGLAKASGRAKYPSDVRPEGTLFGVMLYSPHAHAKIKSIDTAEAEKMPGVCAVWVIKEVAAGKETYVRFQGDDVAAVAALTEEQARDAAHAIKVEYEVLPHCVTEAQSMAADAPKIVNTGNVRPGRAQVDGKPDEAMEASDATIEATYSAPVITHVCLESHGLTAKWEGSDKIVAWASTQSVLGVAGELAQKFNVPQPNVTVHTEVMGGGFGSKFGADIWGVAAAELSKRAGGRPVRMFLDRAQEHMAAGLRPSVTGKIKLGGTKDGKITAMIAESHGTGGFGGSNVDLPYVYSIRNTRRTHTNVFVNTGSARAMRAPGHPQRCLVMESAIDDLAEKLGIDPLEMRLANLAERDLVPGGPGGSTNRSDIYRDEVKIGAELIGWKESRKPRAENARAKGPVKRGLGMALHQWGGGGAPGKQVTCTISPDGSVEIKSATQDIGTGARTIMAIVAAEILGLEVSDITSNIGNSTFPPGQGSGGSTTTPSMAPATYLAVTQARDKLFEKLAPSLGAEPGDLGLKDGQVTVKGEHKMGWKEACRKIGTMPIAVTPAGTAAPFLRELSSVGVGGCQFADVLVDVETGVVRVKKIVAVQDTGLILDLKTWESQVYGGVIGALNYALFEERVMDPTSGVFLNPDMELYKLAGASDIPEIIVKAYDTPAMRARGVIGVGEPPTISATAAIGNAVANAIGVRVPQFPMSPMNVLNALAGKREA